MMSDMLESLILELRRHHLGFDRAMMGCTRSIVIVVIVIHLSLPAEVRGALVFVGSSIVLISSQDLPNITTRVFIQLLIISKDYDRDIDRAENGELMRLLEQAAFALEEGY
jgi:hypothetical protein